MDVQHEQTLGKSPILHPDKKACQTEASSTHRTTHAYPHRDACYLAPLLPGTLGLVRLQRYVLVPASVRTRQGPGFPTSQLPGCAKHLDASLRFLFLSTINVHGPTFPYEAG